MRSNDSDTLSVVNCETNFHIFDDIVGDGWKKCFHFFTSCRVVILLKFWNWYFSCSQSSSSCIPHSHHRHTDEMKTEKMRKIFQFLFHVIFLYSRSTLRSPSRAFRHIIRQVLVIFLDDSSVDWRGRSVSHEISRDGGESGMSREKFLLRLWQSDSIFNFKFSLMLESSLIH